MLWQPRWIAGHLLVLAVVLAFVRLGFWQLDRHGQHVERNARVAERLAEPARPLPELITAIRESDDRLPLIVSSGASASDLEVQAATDVLAHRRVIVSGQWDTDNELLLRSQAYRGQPGWHVLTPLILADPPGAALIVDRGWVPQNLDEPPIAGATPPEGPVRLEGILLSERDPPEGTLSGLAARNPTEGPLDRTFIVDVERLAPQMPYALVAAYLVPTGQDPPQTGDLPVPPEEPGTESATHLAYAVQWFVFASIAVVGYALLLRQRLHEAKHPKGEPPSD